MPETEQNQNQQSEPQANPNTTSSAKRNPIPGIALVFVIILIIASIFWLNAKPVNKTKDNPPLATQPQNVKPVETATTTAQIPDESAVEGTSTIISSINSTSTPPGKILYKNPDFAFELAIPKDWRTQKTTKNIISFYSKFSGKKLGAIEVYNNTLNQSLGDLTVTLENKPDVTKISYTELDSQPALKFTSTSQFKTGISTVYNNRIYYLRGDLTKDDITTGFKFN